MAFLLSFTEILADYLNLELDPIFYLALLFIIILPLTMITNLHLFNKFSKIGLFFALIAVIILILYLILVNGIAEHKFDISNPADYSYTFRFIGVCVFSFYTITLILPIK